jgi:lipid-binding SYLF domain-containing protein
VGFQIGASSTDLIMLVMSERGAEKLLASKFTLGAEGSVAAGPAGRTATAQTGVRPPKAAAKLLELLNRYSGKERKN